MKCPVCGKYDFEEWGDFDICPVCKWENDGLQHNDHNIPGGANHLSVNEARIEYFVMNHPETAGQAAEAKESYMDKFIEIHEKYTGVNGAVEKENTAQMREEYIKNQEEYIDRLSELMMSIISFFENMAG